MVVIGSALATTLTTLTVGVSGQGGQGGERKMFER